VFKKAVGVFKKENLLLYQAIAFASGRNASQNFINWNKIRARENENSENKTLKSF